MVPDERKTIRLNKHHVQGCDWCLVCEDDYPRRCPEQDCEGLVHGDWSKDGKTFTTRCDRCGEPTLSH